MNKESFEREMQTFASLELEPIKVSDSNIGISITMKQLYSCARHFAEYGYNLALKEMPKWRKAEDGYGQMRYRIYLTEKGAYLYDQIEHREINIDELDKLPMED